MSHICKYKHLPHVWPPHSNHSIFSLFSILQTISFHSNFFNFTNLYIISLNLNYLCHLKNFQSQTIFQTIFKQFGMIKNDQNGFPKHKVTAWLHPRITTRFCVAMTQK